MPVKKTLVLKKKVACDLLGTLRLYVSGGLTNGEADVVFRHAAKFIWESPAHEGFCYFCPQDACEPGLLRLGDVHSYCLFDLREMKLLDTPSSENNAWFKWKADALIRRLKEDDV